MARKPKTDAKPADEPTRGLVKMVHEGTGKEADVHPEMVEDYTRGGYRRVG